jgi:oxygen-independent coproporphyrinogen-3 oxidase
MDTARNAFPWLPGAEVTVECNPENLSLPALSSLREAGANRLSLGLQTHEGVLLRALGRGHDWKGFRRVFDRARRAGFDNLNVDLMYGLPRQTLAGWRESLRLVAALSPAHVSVYALSVEERTYFHRSGVIADDDLQADMYEAASDALSSAGYRHYEISNFALPGRECRHNLRTWRNKESLGAGVSAAWYDGLCRRSNTENLTTYLDAVESGRHPPAEAVTLSAEEREGENLMLGLRLSEGVFPSPVSENLYREALGRGVSEGLLEYSDGRYRPTRTGWRLSNRLFLHFLSPPGENPP